MTMMLCAAAIGKTVEKESETIKMFPSDRGMEFWKDFQKDREAILWKSRNVYDISDLAFYLPF